MSSLTSENTFEKAIVESLVVEGGYSEIIGAEYNPEIGFFKDEIISFLKSSQPKRWEKIEAIHGKDVEKRVLARLFKELDLRGSLDVLRNGFTDYGIKFRMAFFQPESGLNPDTLLLYAQNRLSISRQVYFSRKDKKSIDMVIALNGLPILTIELKNHFTGQSTDDAKKQYKETRDPRELLFSFKKRALVHFALDDEEVYMTTKIEGAKTYWLPFNKGDNHGAGNPINPNGYKTDYFWKEILAKDSLMEIVGKFIHLQKEDYIVDGRLYTKEKMIFPRYHQLDVVRELTEKAKTQGAGTNYLIQHSAGSGKSNSIAWLAYRLSSLHNSSDERVFDSVIVITDRRVLDKQLQDTIYQFEHKTGVVQKIDKDSSQLATAISHGKNIIITTLQKFPYVLDKVGEIESRNYAVLIDEAHSSQGGDASKKMKEVLGSPELEDEEDADYTAEDFISDEVAKSAKARGKQSNISFFAFTATPKDKTLSLFGTKDVEGNPIANHLYSMRQAIEEGFIHDVLLNYTTYELSIKLTKTIEDDPNVDKKKASKAIRTFVEFHPHNVRQKSEIIIEHFRKVVAHKIGGKAKAMLVTASRLQAKRYFDAFKKYIEEKGYSSEIKVLVAFSGKVMDEEDLNYPDGVSEPQLTGYGEKELPEVFKKDEYRILIVADKYQTGFDQPLLHTMYIDKKLSGVKAVQTLSRLNRTAIGKEDTFILDFVNDRETILKSFQDYYETTSLENEPDPNHLYDLKGKLDAVQVYWADEVEAFASIYFNPHYKNSVKMQSQLYALIDPAVARYKALESEEKKDEFKKSLRTWTNLYAFVAQVMPFWDANFEKFYAYAKLLFLKLPKRDLGESLQLDDEVALEYYRLEKIKEGNLELQKDQKGLLRGLTEAGIKRSEEEKEPLSEIIKILNDKFGTEFEEADKLFFEQIEEELMSDDVLKKQAQVNTMDTFKYAFDEMFFDKLFGRMEQNQDIFNKILEDSSFGDLVKQMMLKSVYQQMNKE